MPVKLSQRPVNSIVRHDRGTRPHVSVFDEDRCLFGPRPAPRAQSLRTIETCPGRAYKNPPKRGLEVTANGFGTAGAEGSAEYLKHYRRNTGTSRNGTHFKFFVMFLPCLVSQAAKVTPLCSDILPHHFFPVPGVARVPAANLPAPVPEIPEQRLEESPLRGQPPSEDRISGTYPPLPREILHDSLVKGLFQGMMFRLNPLTPGPLSCTNPACPEAAGPPPNVANPTPGLGRS